MSVDCLCACACILVFFSKAGQTQIRFLSWLHVLLLLAAPGTLPEQVQLLPEGATRGQEVELLLLLLLLLRVCVLCVCVCACCCRAEGLCMFFKS